MGDFRPPIRTIKNRHLSNNRSNERMFDCSHSMSTRIIDFALWSAFCTILVDIADNRNYRHPCERTFDRSDVRKELLPLSIARVLNPSRGAGTNTLSPSHIYKVFLTIYTPSWGSKLYMGYLQRYYSEMSAYVYAGQRAYWGVFGGFADGVTPLQSPPSLR